MCRIWCANKALIEAFCKRFAEFPAGHMSAEDDERWGFPKDVVTVENIKESKKINLVDL